MCDGALHSILGARRVIGGEISARIAAVRDIQRDDRVCDAETIPAPKTRYTRL